MDKEIRIKAGTISQIDSILGLEVVDLEVTLINFILIVKKKTKNKMPITQPMINSL